MSKNMSALRFLTLQLPNNSGLINICRSLSTSPALLTYQSADHPGRALYPEPKRWPQKNLRIHEPEKQHERYFCHHRSNIKYSPKKMWYIACFVRGMMIDEAISQLQYIPKKGAAIAREVLQEAQELAVKEHNFEYKSNMWIGESFVGKGLVVKGIRKHARMRFGEVRYFHCHYFVRLVEGQAPKDYYGAEKTGKEKLEQYIEELRSRKIDYAL